MDRDHDKHFGGRDSLSRPFSHAPDAAEGRRTEDQTVCFRAFSLQMAPPIVMRIFFAFPVFL